MKWSSVLESVDLGGGVSLGFLLESLCLLDAVVVADVEVSRGLIVVEALLCRM